MALPLAQLLVDDYRQNTWKIACAFICACLLGRWLWSRRKLYVLSWKLPGPFSLPFVGSIFVILEIVKSGNIHEVARKYSLKYSGLFRLWLGPYLHLIATDPEDVESVFCKEVFAKPPMTIGKAWVNAMGSGLITMTGVGKESPWKEHKKIIYPALAANMNKHYFEGMKRNCLRLEQEMEKLCDKGMVDFGKVLLRFAGESVTETMFGLNWNFREGKYDDLLEALHVMADSVVKRIVNFWYLFEPICYVSSLGRRQRKATRVIRSFAEDVYNEKMKQYNNNEQREDWSEQSLMGVLMKAHMNGQMTKTEVVEEIMSLWIAGADTTGVQLEFCILALAMHKRCQDKAFDEIKAFRRKHDKIDLDLGDVGEFPYIDACVKETVRLFPPGNTAVRYSTEDFEFKSKGITVPADTHLVILSYVTQRDPKLWSEPDAFRPERFFTDECAKMHPFSFFAFSGGPRKCPGRAFAKILLNPAVVHLLSKFEFRCDWKLEELPLSFDIDVRCGWGHKAEITRRIWK